MGVHVAERLPRPRAQAVDAPSRQHRARCHQHKERRQGQRHRPAEPCQRAKHGSRHQHRDEERRDGVGEEILHEFHIVGRHSHQVTGAPSHQIRRRQPIELAEEGNAHLRKHPKGHVVGEPRLQPVQETGERRDDAKHDQMLGKGLAALDRSHGERTGDTHADQRGDTGNAECQHHGELRPPRNDVAQEFAEGADPA